METLYPTAIRLITLHGVAIAWIVILFIFGKVCVKLIARQIAKIAQDEGDKELSERVKTLSHVIVTVGKTVVYIIILFMVLDLFGIDIKPLLAGAGIIGLAIGFGSQSLVRDVVAGFLILVENQYGIGDTVKIGSTEGTVEKITLRSTVLKDKEGNIHFITNGSINNVMNMKK